MKKTKKQFAIEITKRCPELTNKEIQEYVESLDMNGWYKKQRYQFKTTNRIRNEKTKEEVYVRNIITEFRDAFLEKAKAQAKEEDEKKIKK